MNKFRFRYSKPIISLIIAAAVLCVAGIVFNVITLVGYTKFSTIKTVASALILLINVCLLFLVASVGFKGEYVIKDGFLYSYFGFIRSKTDINEVVAATRFVKAEKLVLYFKNAEFTVLIIPPESFADFVGAITKINASIVYSESDEELSDKK